MNRFRFPYVLTLSLSLLSFGAVGCSHGSSPTEPGFDSLAAPVATTSSVTSDNSFTGEKRHGADDPAGDDRGGQTNGGNSGSGNSGSGNSGRGRGGDDTPRPNNPRPTTGSQFEARVNSVSGNTMNLAGGVRVTVNGATLWNARGDLRTLGQVSTAVGRNRPVRAEGRGTRQADGSFVAQTIKVEVDD
jgi:hypothetical protein